jgi:hypothetical protein
VDLALQDARALVDDVEQEGDEKTEHGVTSLGEVDER